MPIVTKKRSLHPLYEIDAVSRPPQSRAAEMWGGCYGTRSVTPYELLYVLPAGSGNRPPTARLSNSKERTVKQRVATGRPRRVTSMTYENEQNDGHTDAQT